MKNLTLAVTLLVAFTATIDARYNSVYPHTTFLKQENKEKIEEETLFVVQGLRGLYNGFEHGLFQQKESADTCLDDGTSKKLTTLIDALFKMNFSNPMSLIANGMDVLGSLKKCSVGSFVAFSKFCFESEEGNCAPEKIMQNLQKNMFVLMGKLTDLSELVQNFPPKTQEDAYKMTYTVGDDVGTVLRVLVNYHDKKATKKF